MTSLDQLEIILDRFYALMFTLIRCSGNLKAYPLFYLHRGEMARPFHQDPQLFEGKRQGFTEQVDAGKSIPIDTPVE